MGIFPVWGFQLLIAITLSFLLRLNKALVIIAANISVPPMIPLILFISHYTGGLWLGKQAQKLSFSTDITFEKMWESFFQYVIGAVTLSIASGVIFGILTYGALKIFNKRPSQSRSAKSKLIE